MQFLALLASLLLFSGTTHGFSVNPKLVVTPPLDIFDPSNKETIGNQVEVRMTSWNKRGVFERGKKTYLLKKKDYLKFRNLAAPVLQMIPRQFGFDREGKTRRGTAFHIGHNLVLTNAHVLSRNFTNTTSCDDFQVRDNLEGNTFSCEKVHFCNVQHDVCLIEMAPLSKGWPWERRTVSLAEGPSLKLRAGWFPSYEDFLDGVFTAIGNSKGLGIHVSQGRGVAKVLDRVYFYAPITGGNSGGALLDQEGLVVGVVKLESQKKIGNDRTEIYNVAASTDVVIELARESLADSPDLLEKFNQSVVE